MRCFSSLGLHGYSGINARLTTPPDFSQSSTPLRLLVPRHPPHALTSLTTLLSSPDDLRQDPVPFEACHPSPGIAFARLGNNSFFPSKAHSSFNLHSNSNYSPSPLRVSPRLEGSARSRLDATFTHSKLSKIAGRPMTLCRLTQGVSTSVLVNFSSVSFAVAFDTNLSREGSFLYSLGGVSTAR